MTGGKRKETRRRQPKQTRAIETCELIFEATAQILERKGERALTTNAIAARAGISVGTLYQYFPDKRAILSALGRREMQRTSLRLKATIQSQPDEAGRLPSYLHTYVHTLRDRPETRKALLRTNLQNASPAELARSAEETTRMLPKLPNATSLDAFVLSRAIAGVVRSAVLEDHKDLYKPEFEAALLRLVSGYRKALLAR